MKRNIGLVATMVVLVFASFAVGQQTSANRTTGPVKRVIQPPNYKPTAAPVSPGILVGDTLYLAGSTGGDPIKGQLVPGGFEPELRQIFSNVQTVLKAADMDLRDVVRVEIYLADIADYNRLNEIYREYFNFEPLPARSATAVKELARSARVELTMTAVRSRRDR